MAVQWYKDTNFKPETQALISTMNNIVDEYIAQGFRLTVRQLYYQMVARGHIENTERSYKRITGIVNDARLAGLMDWDAIEDRTREFIKRSRWAGGADILKAAADSFHMDHWSNQDCRLFVIVEKEALAGVLEGICRKYDVPLLPARGYPSGTVLREFVRTDLFSAEEQEITILHLGDHDPSGIDMTRDLRERIDLFFEGQSFDLQRIALNMPQIEEQSPPPNPAKTTDSRFESYMREHGHESWELDALSPAYLSALVEGYFDRYIDSERWDERSAEIEEIRGRIRKAAGKFL